MSPSETKVVNELLTYIQYHLIRSISIDELIEKCAKEFTYGDISSALKLLLESLEIEERMSYREMFKKEEILMEIIKLLQQIERSEVPTFVAKELHKLPPVKLVVRDLIDDFSKLMNTLAAAQKALESIQFQINTCNQKIYRRFQKTSDEPLSQNVTYSTEVGAAILIAPSNGSAQGPSADQEITTSVSPHVLVQKRKDLNSAERTEVNRQPSSSTDNANPQMVKNSHTKPDADIILPVPFKQEKIALKARKINHERRVTFDDSVKTITINYQKRNNPKVSKERKKRLYRRKTTDERNRTAIEYSYDNNNELFCVLCQRSFKNKGGYSSHYLKHERDKRRTLINRNVEAATEIFKGLKSQYDPQLTRNTQAGSSHSNSRPISQDPVYVINDSDSD